MLVQGDLTGAATAARQPAIDAMTTALIDNALTGTEMEVVYAISGQLPARQTCQLLGFPELTSASAHMSPARPCWPCSTKGRNGSPTSAW